MSTSPTFNTVTARSINLNNPGSMSAAGTVIARNITATGNIWAANPGQSGTFGQISSVGTITGGNLLTLGTATAQSVVGTVVRANNSLSIGASTTIQNSGMTTGGNISATGNITGGNLVTVGRITATGNITGTYLFGNGAFLTGITGGGGSSYGNANVVANLAALSSNPVSTTGNISAGNVRVGTSVLTANSLSVLLDVAAGRNVQGANLFGTIRTANQPAITQVGNLTNLTVSNQIQAGSMSLTGAILAGGPITGTTISGSGLSISGSATISGNLTFNAGGRISTTGNIAGGYIIGDGSQLTNVGGPTFMATATVGQNIPSSPLGITQMPLIYNSVAANIGSGYNNANGIFTAPKAGFYQVSACCAVTPSNWAQVLNYYAEGVIGVYKNGSPVAAGPYISFRGLVIGGVVIQAITPSSISTLVRLEQNDTVQCRLAYITNAPTNFWRTYDLSFVIPNYFQIAYIRS